MTRRTVPAAMALICGAFYGLGAARSFDYDSSVTVGLFVRPNGWQTPLTTVHEFNNHTLFSMVEWCVWHLGGHSEAALRMAPILFAAAAVGVLTSWVLRRYGVWPAVAAGAILTANPEFAKLSRDLRGYSLATLGVIASTTWLLDHLNDDRPTQTGRYIVAIAAAIATHFMCLIVLGVHVVMLLTARRHQREWWTTVALAAVAGLAPLMPVAADLIALARTQQPRFRPTFPIDTVKVVLGSTWLSWVALAALIAIGTAATRSQPGPPVTRQAVRLGTVSLLAVLGVEWLVLKPPNLDPRFVIWLVPAVAGLAARQLSSITSRLGRRAAAALTVLAVAGMIGHVAPTWTTPELPLREATVWIRNHPELHRLCADGAVGESFLGYEVTLNPVVHRSGVEHCDAVVQVGPPSPYRVMGEVRRQLPVERRFRGQTDVVVHLRRSPDAGGDSHHVN